MNIETVVVTPFDQNCRIIVSGSDVVVVDPGGDTESIIRELDKLNRKQTAIWLTHSHLDHAGGVAELLKWHSSPLYGHQAESYMRQHIIDIAINYGLPASLMQNCPEPTDYLVGGERLHAGESKFEVLHTPGHSPGHLSFYCEQSDILIAGDTIFDGGIGRTDLPGSDPAIFEVTLKKLLSLPNSTRILSGHGGETTIANAKLFLNGL